MKRIGKFLFLFSVLGVLMLGCVATQPTSPNISAFYRIPALEVQLPPLQAKSKQSVQEPIPVEVGNLFQQLYSLDPELALEVGKLPEFQGKVGEKQVMALSRFVTLIEKATPGQKDSLAEFLTVGKPVIRRYSTPLQAVFWILERDGKANPLRLPLTLLLAQAWNYTDQTRWGDFKIVTDRLNSPELINYYERRNFKYVSHGHCEGYPKSIFKSGRGCCSDYTAFSVYCLKKAGYEAMAIRVESPTGKTHHIVAEYKKDGKEYIMDNSCYTCTSGGIVAKEVYVKKLPQHGFGYW